MTLLILPMECAPEDILHVEILAVEEGKTGEMEALCRERRTKINAETVGALINLQKIEIRWIVEEMIVDGKNENGGEKKKKQVEKSLATKNPSNKE